MHTMDQARKIILDAHPGMEIENEYDYDDLYVFVIQPKNYDIDKEGAYLDSFYQVDKKTGEMQMFYPMEHFDFLDRFSKTNYLEVLDNI